MICMCGEGSCKFRGGCPSQVRRCEQDRAYVDWIEKQGWFRRWVIRRVPRTAAALFDGGVHYGWCTKR